MPTDGVHVSPSGQKAFIPLENNPSVFTSLIHDLGISAELCFHDVYSLDDPDLLSLVPRPALALIFITPAPPYHTVRAIDGTPSVEDGLDSLTYDKCGDEEPVMWFRQTINNACGLMALLHAVANGEAREFVREGSTLGRLLQQAAPLKPRPRADMLHASEELERAHMRAARLGDTTAPRAEDPCEHHFLAFVKGRDGHLWELEGSSDGPIDRGEMREREDMLSEASLERGVRRFMRAADGNLGFSVVALARRPGGDVSPLP
ncbi:ubiquitin carboxyl-terminal hydrolase, family 1 [Trematosphaeria pertusa]|uniref:Ubiquitin carboxyl-terminal hydrolase n=1 Tax=Trematosphaeria pertusa TaxID=390896 RepID=A0A6A6IZ46_9PLEO|nr:ubiquitin carboxyl-terminal hydrolase, family 1 [Trematosphaeria pertusa]KAF2255851.1 ubiquitin carboxyl-terminal hydrolase, family 1 [Trematosphaeria pertusa]